jgi:hypothetical protein
MLLLLIINNVPMHNVTGIVETEAYLNTVSLNLYTKMIKATRLRVPNYRTGNDVNI